MSYHENQTYDRLRGEFTSWLEKVIVRAKLDYIRNNRQYLEIVSMDELSEEAISVCEEPYMEHKDNFDFEDVRIEQAFMKLSVLYRRILTMLFLEEKSPDEIATELGCSVDSVYSNRSRALKKLREALRREEN